MLTRSTKTVLAGITVLAVVGLGSGIAYAQGDGPPPPSASGADGGPDRGPAPWKHHRHLADGIGPGGIGPGRIEHGVLTVRTDTGHQAVEVQRGTVTAVNGSSLTVRSEDGFSDTYTVDQQTKVHKARERATIDQVAVNDQVIVFADAATGVAQRIGVPGSAK